MLNDPTSVEVGDILVAEVSGRENLALLDASVKTIIDDEIVLDFRRPPRYEVAREKFRTLVQNVRGSVNYEGENVDLEVLDISEQGLGLLSFAPVQTGSRVKLSLETPYGPVKVSGLVRYCRSDPKRIGLYRAGLYLDEMGRLDRARWNKLCGVD
jgi:hypothetical protein